MSVVKANGVAICYDRIGRPGDPAVVLITGLGGQLVAWDDEFCEALAARGLYVIRFDNRDAGMSSKTSAPVPKLRHADGSWQLEGHAPYTLGDMADDTVGLLDALGVDAAHIVGISLGGMIAQHVAMAHPNRTLSLTVISSTTGDPRVGWQAPEAVAAMRDTPPPQRQGYIDTVVRTLEVIGGPRFDAERARRIAAAQYDRSYWPRGVAYQLAARVADGDRTARLSAIRCPTLVIHGHADPQIHVSGGHALAAAIADARLMVLDEMGHDLAPALFDAVVNAIANHVDDARAGLNPAVEANASTRRAR
jgi:pimeloyl-ACP methyl ester carboxylesterase